MSLKNLDFKNVSSWPMSVKLAACVLTAGFVGFMGWQFILSGQIEERKGLERREVNLRSDFEDKAGRAANLEPLKEQLERMEDLLAQQLRQLPSKTEMPQLIIDISRVALRSGIRVELFQPGTEATREFYAERPISMRMVGNYHQFGEFVSGVASLPRVVIMASENLSLTPREVMEDGNVMIVMEGTVRTYRSLDEQETLEQERIAADAREAERAEAARANRRNRANRNAASE